MSDDDSIWSFVVIDDNYAESQATSPLDKAHTDLVSLSSAGAHLSKTNDNPIKSEERGDIDAAPPTPQPLQGTSQASCLFNDEELPLKDDADTFIITRQNYPSERNGTLRNEMVAAVRAPLVTTAQAGEAWKRKAEDTGTAHIEAHIRQRQGRCSGRGLHVSQRGHRGLRCTGDGGPHHRTDRKHWRYNPFPYEDEQVRGPNNR